MDSSLQRPSISQEAFSPKGGKNLGMYQGGRSRNFRMAQGLQFVAKQRDASPETSVVPAGETDVAVGFAASGSGLSAAMAIAGPDRR